MKELPWSYHRHGGFFITIRFIFDLRKHGFRNQVVKTCEELSELEAMMKGEK